MKKILILLLAALAVSGLWAQAPGPRTLYVYDEVNKNSTPYIAYFREAFAAEGIPFDEAPAAKLAGMDLSPYDRIVVHGMVMAFNSKSPVRDWLTKAPDLLGKRVYLFVTANRWFLDNLFGQLTKLLKQDGGETVDAVSMATKDIDDSGKKAAVASFVRRIR